MNRLPFDKRVLILRSLCSGAGVCGTARTAAVTKGAVLRTLVAAGKVCSEYQDEHFRKLPCRRIQVDECWAFLHVKQANLPWAKAAPPGAGDLWTWTAICADTKLVPSWLVGDRGLYCAIDLFRDLRSRLLYRPQITTDGLDAYFDAVPYVFGEDGSDFAAVVKLYGDSDHAVHVTGKPDPDHINTCFVERHYLTMRMSMRRYTRRTTGFSRKLENHGAMLTLSMFDYNLIQPHASLRRKGGAPTTPAMAAGITDRRMRMEDIVTMIDEEYERTRPKTRGPYRKRAA